MHSLDSAIFSHFHSQKFTNVGDTDPKETAERRSEESI